MELLGFEAGPKAPTLRRSTPRLSAWPKERPTADICVLSDATSAVGGFEKEAGKFFDDMQAAGVTLVKAADWQPKKKKP